MYGRQEKRTKKTKHILDHRYILDIAQRPRGAGNREKRQNLRLNNFTDKVLSVDGVAFFDEEAGDGAVVGCRDDHFLRDIIS